MQDAIATEAEDDVIDAVDELGDEALDRPVISRGCYTGGQHCQSTMSS